MQFENKNRLISGFFLIGLMLMVSSCLKKIEEVDNLNTNIFDREYTGDQWYMITSAQQVSVDGQIRVYVYTRIKDEYVPALEPSLIQVVVSAESYDNEVVDFNKSPTLGYSKIISLPYNGATADYCINLALYDEEQDEGINPFDDCTPITD